MATITLGGKTYDLSNQSDRADARAANPGMVIDASSAFNSGTGQQIDASSGGGGGGGGGGAPQQTYPGVNTADLQRIQAGFAASSGLSIKQLDEQAREFDANLDWQKQMWTNQGLPQLAIQQRAQDLAEKQFATTSGLAARQQDFVEEQGRRQAALAEKTQSDANTIAQSTLGLDTLKTAASLSGPADWIKAANFSRGVAQSNLPGFMTQLLTGQPTAAMGGPAAGAQMSVPLSLQSMAAGMGAQTGTPGSGTVFAGGSPTFNEQTGQGSNVDAAANGLRNIFSAGGQALGPQQLEGLTPTEKSMFEGGGSDLGADVPGFEAAYQRSRIGQQSALPGWL